MSRSTSSSKVGSKSAGGRLGPYRILRLLGTGGVGEVLLAHDDRLDRRVAIKRIRHGEMATSLERQRFLREARAAAQLSHPAIVRVFEILEGEEKDALVMEYVEGETIAQRLRQGPFETLDVLHFAREIAEALAEAHGKGIIHRDLKAENVMTTAHGHAKILDFGLAKRVRRTASDDPSLTAEGTVLGTCRSMSPEQAAGRDVDERSDLFSFGVLLYEMTTGISPFSDTSPLKTLYNVARHHPSLVQALRPEIPEALSSLIARLLEKEVEKRPASAAQVAREIGRILSQETASQRGTDAFGDAPTGSIAHRHPPAFEPRQGVRRRRAAWLGLGAVVLVLAFFTTVFLVRQPEPRRVAVLPPEIPDGDEAGELALVAAAVLDGILEALITFQGVNPVDPDQTAPVTGSPAEVARAVAADEALSAVIQGEEGLARVSLRRIAEESGQVLWSRTLKVPRSPDDARVVAEGIGVHLRDAYPGHPSADGDSWLEVRDRDYTDFLRVKLRIDSGNVSWKAELEELERILAGSPNFLEARLLAAGTATTLFTDTRDPGYLHRAAGFLEQARSLAPKDPRPLYHDFRLTLESGDTVRAAAVLAELERLAPQDLHVPLSFAALAERRGELADAVTAMRTVVERHPSWRNLYRIASLELADGEIEAARGHLEELLRRAPGNTWGLGKLLELETTVGDLERAEEVALSLLEVKRHRSYLTNLGLVRFLLGRYEEAKASYLEALDLDPAHPTVLLNLADTESALGHREAAASLYRQILEQLRRKEESAALTVAEEMNRAQCLAQLGESQRAVEITLEVLKRHGDSADVAYQAALVYALAGESRSAVAKAHEALAGNIDRRWFAIPGFDSLRRDPDFAALLDPGAASRH